MKILLETGIYGTPAKLNLRAKILYGSKNQFEKKVFWKRYSMDDGGSLTIDLDFFERYAENNNIL